MLESEYQRNAKPDKAARTSIVNRVSLGEKEVQVCDAKNRHSKKAASNRHHTDLVPKPPPKRSPQIQTTATTRVTSPAVGFTRFIWSAFE